MRSLLPHYIWLPDSTHTSPLLTALYHMRMIKGGMSNATLTNSSEPTTTSHHYVTHRHRIPHRKGAMRRLSMIVQMMK